MPSKVVWHLSVSSAWAVSRGFRSFSRGPSHTLGYISYLIAWQPGFKSEYSKTQNVEASSLLNINPKTRKLHFLYILLVQQSQNLPRFKKEKLRPPPLDKRNVKEFKESFNLSKR